MRNSQTASSSLLLCRAPKVRRYEEEERKEKTEEGARSRGGPKMCINVGSPAWSRVRHWSAPERTGGGERHPAVAGSSSQGARGVAGKDGAPECGQIPSCATVRLPWETPLTLEDEFEALASIHHRVEEDDGHEADGVDEKDSSPAPMSEDDSVDLSLLAGRLLSNPLILRQKLYQLRLVALQQKRICRETLTTAPLNVLAAMTTPQVPEEVDTFNLPSSLPPSSPGLPTPDESRDDDDDDDDSQSDVPASGPFVRRPQPSKSSYHHAASDTSAFLPVRIDQSTSTKRRPVTLQEIEPGEGEDETDEEDLKLPRTTTRLKAAPKVSSNSSQPPLPFQCHRPATGLDWRESAIGVQEPSTHSSYGSCNQDCSCGLGRDYPPPTRRARASDWTAEWPERPASKEARVRVKKRDPEVWPRWPPWSSASPSIQLPKVISAILLLCSVLVAPVQARICETTTVKTVASLEQLRGCDVIEGNLVISIGILNDAGLPPRVDGSPLPDLNASFPELREVTEYLMLYGSQRVPRFTHMFPNLAVIRGNKLFENYALIVFQNPDLEEIGLTGLTRILRGGVRITYNPKLCYANTVDWDRLADQSFREYNTIKENQVQNACPELCPQNCPTHSRYHDGRKICWNEDTCQRVELKTCPAGYQTCYSSATNPGQITTCDRECVGGCADDNPDECFACKNVLFEGDSGSRTCYRMCPNEYLLFKNWRCITKTECKNKSVVFSGESIQDTVEFKQYEGQCLEECPGKTKESIDPDGTRICVECKDCPKKCNGDIVSSLGTLMAFEDCTHILGDLTIELSGANVVQQLAKYLGRVREIGGSLKISRTYSVVSLDFFENLEVIHGKSTTVEEGEYSLKILENENLQKLFPVRMDGSSVRILSTDPGGYTTPGKAFIHYNARLCKQEITDLIARSGLEDPGQNSADISYATNGGKAVCGARKLTVKLSAVSSRIVTFSWENYKQTIQDEWPEANIRTLLGYKIHLRQISDSTYNLHNLTKYDGRDACGGDDWKVLDHAPTRISKDDDKVYWPEENSFFQVDPYTSYAFFISTLLLKEYVGSENVQGAESDIIYFQTPADVPQPPAAVSVERTSPSSFNLSWEPPIMPNGVIDHYEIVLTFNEINAARLMDRPYCKDGSKVESVPEIVTDVPEPPKSPTNGTCDCEACNGGVMKKPKKIKPTNDKMDEEHFFDAVIDRVFDSASPGPAHNEGARKKRSVGDKQPKGAAGATNYLMLDKDVANAMNGTSGVGPKDGKTAVDDGISEEDDDLERVPVKSNILGGEIVSSYRMPKRRVKQISEDEKIYLTFSARVSGDARSLYVPNLKHFGSYTLKVRACQAKYSLNNSAGDDDDEAYEKFCSMDVVKEVRVLHRPGADDIVSPVRTIVQNDTNSVWLSWEPPADPNELIVNYWLQYKTKLDSPGSGSECVTAKDFKENDNRFRPDRTGSYYVRVRAVSVYGDGNWTEYEWITVPGQHSTMIIVIVVPIVVVLLVLAIVAVAYYYNYYKKSKELQGGFVSINGAYVPVSELYKADHWEVDRNHVTVGEELGRGAFGRVNKGTYEDPEKGSIDCAIKTVRENAPHDECIKFLQEVYTMKTFDTVHVVKLLGVVTRCQPHLVLLELMEDGDLKGYLRSLRPPEAEEDDDLEAAERLANAQAAASAANWKPPEAIEIKQMALEIADGMAYLSSHHKRFVHRDLAARNCLITGVARGDPIVKIADFGMAREIYAKDYYKKGDKGMMPVRWMAPESLRDGTSIISSDVWSFGIVMWEMVTLAQLPYQGYSNEQVVERVIQGHTLGAPANCPEDLYALMKECWQMNEKRRPSFLDLCEKLLPIANQRFRNNSFITSAAGEEALEAQRESRRIKEELEAAAALERAQAEEAENETTPCLQKTPVKKGGGGGGGGANGHNSNSNGDAYSTSATTTENGHVANLSSNSTEMRTFNRQQSAPAAGGSGGREGGSGSRNPVVMVIAEGTRSAARWGTRRLRNLSGSGGGSASDSRGGGGAAGGVSEA